MPSLAEIANALTGSMLLARRDTSGYGYFNQSVDGFWSSFFAIFLLAPFYLAIGALERDVAAVGGVPIGDPPAGLAAQIVVLTVQWFAFPLAMVPLARLLGLDRQYVPFIIAYNWSSVPAIAFLSLPYLLFAAGLAGAQAVTLVSFLAMLAVIYYRWFVTRTALGTNAGTAAGIVVFDHALSLHRSFISG